MKRLVALLAIMLLSFGLSNAVDNIRLQMTSDGSDTIRVGSDFTFDVGIENGQQWGGMSLGFQIWSPDGATWTWVNKGVLGFGTSKVVTVNTSSRINPPATVWDFGFLITEQDLDNTTPDQILLGGVANAGGLTVGAMQDMMYLNLHCVAGDTKQICIDSIKVGAAGDFVFSDMFGGSFPPTVAWTLGGICYPVAPTRNAPPTFTDCPSSAINLHHCVTGTVPLHAIDVESDPFTFAFVSTTGGGSATVTGGGLVTYIPVPADANSTVDVVVSVADAFTTVPNTCTVQFAYDNQLPTIACPPNFAVAKGNPFTAQVTGADLDGCDTKVFNIVSVTPVLATPPTINIATGLVSGVTAAGLVDIGLHTILVEMTDGIATVQCSFTIDVLLTEPFEIGIQKAHNVLQGHYYDLHIVQTLGTLVMGGFDFLIAYDASALTFSQATPGAMLTQCGWEYFTYRYGPDGNCGNGCPSGMIRIVAMAETNNGPHHPVAGCTGTDLVVLTFLVSNNRTLDCQFVPIRFFWYDCGDNTISTPDGDSLLISRYVYDYAGTGGVDTWTEITDNAYGFPGWFGAPTVPCMVGDKVHPIRFIDFKNGGIDIVCADSIDARGDINANGVANEIADAVMFTNYYITGLSAFGTHVESSIAASDVNADGIALSVADLVYLIRIIVGDVHPYSKPLPGANVTFSAQGNVVTYTAGTELGAAWLVFNVKSAGAPVLGDGAAKMDVVYSLNGSTLKVLVYNIGSNAIASGTHTLMTVPGEGLELVSVEVADYNGNALNASVKNLPTSYMLAQNAPNPFNPSTKIAFTMPVSSDYSIAIYNVAGQLVNQYNGHSEAGTVEVTWDGTDRNHTSVASGIYFYKATANNFSATKKMVLMK